MLVFLSFYATVTIFQLYLGGDMMYEMQGRKSEPTLLLTQGIVKLPHHINTVRVELAFGDAVSYIR